MPKITIKPKEIDEERKEKIKNMFANLPKADKPKAKRPWREVIEELRSKKET